MTATPAKFIDVTRPRCPACRSADLRVYKTDRPLGDAIDAMIVRYTLCKTCGHKFQQHVQ